MLLRAHALAGDRFGDVRAAWKVLMASMTDGEFSILWSALDDLPILFKLDVVHFERVANHRLRENVLNEGVDLYALN